MEEIPATLDSSPLDLVPLKHTMSEGDNESSDIYWAETDTSHPLAELLEQFQQLKDQFASLKSTTPQSTPMAELMHLTEKLQHLTMMLHPHSSPQPKEEPVHKTMQAYTDTLCATLRESNLTTTMLHDTPTFNGQESSKLEGWFMDIETTTDILQGATYV